MDPCLIFELAKDINTRDDSRGFQDPSGGGEFGLLAYSGTS